MKGLLVVLFILAFEVSLADEVTVQFEQANQLYRNGKYSEAGELYELILSQGYESPELYYNLGNTFFKLRNIPAAILHYERGNRLAPGDDDIDHNLRLAGLRVVDRIEPVPQLFFVQWWQDGINVFSADQWATVAIVALWCMVICGAFLFAGRVPLLRRAASIVVPLSLALTVLAFIAIVERSHLEEGGHTAIVFSPGVSVKSAPDDQSTDLFLIHEGTKVELLDRVGEWHEIRLADGKIGWLPAESMEVI